MIRALILRGLPFVALWLILSEGRQDGWLLGGIAVAAATWASLKLWPPAPTRIHLIALPGLLRFFLWNSVLSGMQVAWMALRGRAALQPDIIELTVTLPPGMPRILLVNALGLMPGTLGIDMDDAKLSLHVLDAGLPVVAEARALEAAIAALFGSPA